MKKPLLIIAVFAVIVFMLPKVTYAAAAEVVIDGQFGEWGSIDSYDISGQSELFEQASLAYDEQYVYIHVKESKSKAWDTNYPTININCDGTSKNIVIVRTDYSNKNGVFELQVKNDWWTVINNTEAKVLRANNYNEWELKLPIYDVFVSNSNEQTEDNLQEYLADSLSVSWSTGGSVSVSGTYVGEPIPTSTPTPAVTPGLTPIPSLTPTDTPVDSGGTGGGLISIDGYYDDWENMPKTNIYYNANKSNTASLVKDENYIYLYVGMSSSNNNQIPLTGISMTINNTKTCELFINYPNSDGTTDWSHNINKLSQGIYTGLSPFTYYPNSVLGDAVVNINNGTVGDQLELRIDISDLEQNLGLDAGTISSGVNISVNLPNVGGQTLEAVGVSTEANLGILISIVTVIIVSVYKFRRMKIKQ